MCSNVLDRLFQNHICRWTLTLVGQLAADGHIVAVTEDVYIFDSAAQKDRQVPNPPELFRVWHRVT